MITPLNDPYYHSQEYRDAIDAASKDASFDPTIGGNEPNRPKHQWNGRFVAALAERGLELKENLTYEPAGRPGTPFPMMAPIPYPDGGPPYPYPSYVVCMPGKRRPQSEDA